MITEWDRKELENTMRYLETTAAKLVAAIAAVEHRMEVMYGKFDAARLDDDQRWNKLFIDLKSRFEEHERKITELQERETSSDND